MNKLKRIIMIGVLSLIVVVVGKGNLFGEELKLKNVLSFNPFGLLVTIFNVEYERVISPDITLGPKFYYLADEEGDWKWSMMGVGGKIKKFTIKSAPQGAWFGGEGNIMRTLGEYKQEKEKEVFFNILGEAGYRWIYKNQITLELLIFGGLTKGKMEIHGENIPVKRTDGGLGFNIGYAF